MNIEIIPVQDPRFVLVGSELRNEVLEKYEIYLSDIDEEDQLTREIRKDIEEGSVLTLNAFAAQSFVEQIEDQLSSKKSGIYKAIKRFYVESGIYKELDKNVEQIVFSGSTGRSTKAKPEFTLNGIGYSFDAWLKLEGEEK